MKKTAYLSILLLTLNLVGCGGGGGASGDTTTPDNTEQASNPNQFDCDRLVDFDPSNPDHVNVCAKDADKDGIVDDMDNCPTTYNVNQTDTDSDLMGDACDPDADNDGIDNDTDNCPVLANSDQANLDGDELGDACDRDKDNDNYDDELDNCPLFANTDQADLDGDGIGDACDPDLDNDGVENVADNCPVNENPDQSDLDKDGIGDACDTANVVRKCIKLLNKEYCYDIPVYPPAPAQVCSIDKEYIAKDLSYYATDGSVDVTQVTQDNIDAYPQLHLPPSSSSSNTKVTQRQMFARIMVGAAMNDDKDVFNNLVRDVFNGTRLANNATEYWDNCAEQEKWSNMRVSGKLYYSTDSAPMSVYQNHDKIIIVFDGTDPARENDLYNDATVSVASYQGVDFHAGIVNHYDQHKTKPHTICEGGGDCTYQNLSLVQILNELDPNNATNPRELIFSGHSLGGSTANLAFYDYVVRYKTSSRRFPSSYTFGENAFVEKGENCYWDLNWPFRHCHDNVDSFDNTPVYGYRTSTVAYNQIHNFANVNTNILKYDPVPHLFRRFSHAGLHYTLFKKSDTDDTPGNGSVEGTWRIRSSYHYESKGGFDVKVDVGTIGAAYALAVAKAQRDIIPHALCFYARNLEYAVGDPTFKWVDDTATKGCRFPSNSAVQPY